MNSRLQKAFECSICLEFFENPRMLPCGHSYCGSPRTCLTDLLNLSDPPKCAVCKQDILVDVLDEDKLTKNFDLGSASEVRKLRFCYYLNPIHANENKKFNGSRQSTGSGGK